jgi:hypothetical protein
VKSTGHVDFFRRDGRFEVDGALIGTRNALFRLGEALIETN